MEKVEWEFGSLLMCPASANSPSSRLLSTQQIFRPTIKAFFSFSQGMITYQAPAGTEATLFVDKRFFPKGLSLLSFDFFNFSRASIDLGFSLEVEQKDGTQFSLTPFDLLKGKRLNFGFCLEYFSQFVALKFNNTEAANPTSFSMGCLMLRA